MMQRVSAKFYLGVDGGGTRCRARLQTGAGETIGTGTGGPANVRLGHDLVWSNILNSIDDALEQAGLTRAALRQTAAGFGLAGILRPEDGAGIAAHAETFQSLDLSSDAHTACLGAFGGADGGIQIVGTGSSGYAIVNGTGHARGGWGFALAEKASGAALGRDGVRAALEALEDADIASPFTTAVISHFGSAVDIVDWSDTARPSDYAALAPLVFRYAGQDDPIASALVRKTAADCGKDVTALIKFGAPSVCLLGGLAAQIRPWLAAPVVAHLAEPQADALDGALLLARQSQAVNAQAGAQP